MLQTSKPYQIALTEMKKPYLILHCLFIKKKKRQSVPPFRNPSIVELNVRKPYETHESLFIST